MNYSIFELFKILNTTASSVTKSSLKSFLVCRARTCPSFGTKFNILFVKINILILNNSFISLHLISTSGDFFYLKEVLLIESVIIVFKRCKKQKDN